MSASRMKVYKREFVLVFGREPDGKTWDMWKAIREKSGKPTLSKLDIEQYQLQWQMLRRKLEAQRQGKSAAGATPHSSPILKP